MEQLQPIKSKIYTFRGRQVLLDRDLAEMYGVEVKRLNESVKRNIKRFPEDFAFQLNHEELSFLRSQIATIKNGRGEHSKYTPFVFTEQGVAMLSGILNSDTAIEVNIRIMRAFVAMRQQIALPTSASPEMIEQRIQRIEQTLEESLRDRNDIDEDTRMRLELIEQSIAELQAVPNRGRARIKGFAPD